MDVLTPEELAAVEAMRKVLDATKGLPYQGYDRRDLLLGELGRDRCFKKRGCWHGDSGCQCGNDE